MTDTQAQTSVPPAKAKTTAEVFQENMQKTYIDALRQFEALRSRQIMAYSAMDAVDRVSKSDPKIREAVRYELGIRLNYEMHTVMDALFARMSGALTKKDAKGIPMACPVCAGQCSVCWGTGRTNEGAVCLSCQGRHCKACNNSGAVVDHGKTIYFKQFIVSSESAGLLQQLAQLLSGGNREESIRQIYDMYYTQGIRGSDAEVALGMVAPSMKISGADVKALVDGYYKYCADRDAESKKAEPAKAEAKSAPAKK